MELILDEEAGGFTFSWEIHNFSYCLLKKYEPLFSPKFKLNFSDSDEWELIMYPRGNEKDDCMEVYLSVKSFAQFPVNVKHHISIRATDGTFKRRPEDFSPHFEDEDFSPQLGPQLGLSQLGLVNACFLNHSDLFKNDAFLENDTLTVRCQLWKQHPELAVSGQWYARTEFQVERIALYWTWENIEEFLHYGRKTFDLDTETQSFTVDMCLFGEKNMQVEIKRNTPHGESYLTCKLSLLDADRQPAQTVLALEHCFDFRATQETKKWQFAFMPVEEVLDQEKLYLVDYLLHQTKRYPVNADGLFLRCEFAVSTGEQYKGIELTEYGVYKEDYKDDDKTRYENKGFPWSWKGNLQKILKEGKFSDLTIRTASRKVIPVHKAILCARSEVFRLMFENDTKENRTGIVEIKEVNDDTVSKMLLFTYTDILEDLDWETAPELYFAADKYGIVALKRKCSNFFKSNLDISNACNVRALAEVHQDEDLKSAVQGFILDCLLDVNSKYWKKF